jgi:DNA/RNA endonuclease YhcR with UshA esterase domain
MKQSMVSLLGAALLAVSVPASAHHAVSAEFDTHKPISFSGTVKQVEWTNPHIYTQIEVKNPDGTMTVYRVEGGAPNSLFRQGWRKDTLKPGEVVSVQGFRAKNENSMNIGQATITTSDGRRMFGQTGGQAQGGGQQQ